MTFSFLFNLAAKEDNFRWQDAAGEVDGFPFSKAFIDSIKNEHLSAKTARSSHYIEKELLSQSETLIYEVQWGPIKAGYLILSASPRSPNGQIRLGAKLLSNNYVSSIFKIRDYIISWVDAKELYPLFFEQHTREGKYKKDEYVIYDTMGERIIAGGKKSLKEIKAPPFTHDFISALYYTRSMELKPGDTFTINTFVDYKIYPIKLKVKSKETVKVNAGKFKCVLIEPKLVGDGDRLNKHDKLEIWISDDEHRVPVMAKSKVKVGSVTAKLVRISRHKTLVEDEDYQRPQESHQNDANYLQEHVNDLL
ncbi:MAG: DUF3108 domain-containing protein [Chitinispirillales bacterium]|jgi:hypothetical protein|nr:DUF3108 domain-containing protein [Chitinispirillales bacterium]